MKWIICFCESPNIGLWKFFTKNKPQFSHVFAIRYIPQVKHWIAMEYVTTGFKCSILTKKEATQLVAFCMSKCVCLEYEPKDLERIHVPRLSYCVSFVKHLCNINKFWILTPYQLYCELLKRGGKSIFEKKEKDYGIFNTKNTSTRSSIGKGKIRPRSTKPTGSSRERNYAT